MSTSDDQLVKDWQPDGWLPFKLDQMACTIGNRFVQSSALRTDSFSSACVQRDNVRFHDRHLHAIVAAEWECELALIVRCHQLNSGGCWGSYLPLDLQVGTDSRLISYLGAALDGTDLTSFPDCFRSLPLIEKIAKNLVGAIPS